MGTIKKKQKLKPLITNNNDKNDKEEMDGDEQKEQIDSNKNDKNDKQELDEDEQKEIQIDLNKNDKNNENDATDTYELVEEKVKFEFDSSDLQRYLDANSEIIGRLQTIRREKSFYGVTQEEIDLSKQFAKNTAAIVQYASLP